MIKIGTHVAFAFASAPSVPRLAIVAETRAENPDLPNDETVSLVVCGPADITHVMRAPWSATLQPGHWTELVP
jgi:hypothetical protein